MGKLYLVATPIGNLSDLSKRAIEVLDSSPVIACEDTRKTGQLLKTYSISKKKLVSLYEENEVGRIPQIIGFLENSDVALVSNAGTPTISDPGFKLVRSCIEKNIEVIPVPGSSSVIAALSASGLPTDKFLFLGFLPKKDGSKTNFLKKYLSFPCPVTIIFFESPFRLEKTLNLILNIFGDVPFAIAHELTKMNESFLRGSVSRILAQIKKKKIKGELTCLMHLS